MDDQYAPDRLKNTTPKSLSQSYPNPKITPGRDPRAPPATGPGENGPDGLRAIVGSREGGARLFVENPGRALCGGAGAVGGGDESAPHGPRRGRNLKSSVQMSACVCDYSIMHADVCRCDQTVQKRICVCLCGCIYCGSSCCVAFCASAVFRGIVYIWSHCADTHLLIRKTLSRPSPTTGVRWTASGTVPARARPSARPSGGKT